jgi:ferritin-like metal-binding protein YciE
MDTTNTTDAALVARINDLLQLDHDAVAAYTLAIKELDSPRLKQELQAHLNDHQRHIEELERHLDRIGGMKVPVPHVSGVFKLAVQAVVGAASDRKVLLAFKANEMQVRDKYMRAAEGVLPIEVRDTVGRAAQDEQRHYEWAVMSLEQLGADEDDVDVRITKGVAAVHGRTADAIEAGERAAMTLAERARRVVKNDPVKTLVTAGLAVVGAGVLLGSLARRR